MSRANLRNVMVVAVPKITGPACLHEIPYAVRHVDPGDGEHSHRADDDAGVCDL